MALHAEMICLCIYVFCTFHSCDTTHGIARGDWSMKITKSHTSSFGWLSVMTQPCNSETYPFSLHIPHHWAGIWCSPIFMDGSFLCPERQRSGVSQATSKHQESLCSHVWFLFLCTISHSFLTRKNVLQSNFIAKILSHVTSNISKVSCNSILTVHIVFL